MVYHIAHFLELLLTGQALEPLVAASGDLAHHINFLEAFSLFDRFACFHPCAAVLFYVDNLAVSCHAVLLFASGFRDILLCL